MKILKDNPIWSTDLYDQFSEDEIKEYGYDILDLINEEDFDNIFPKNEHQYAGLCVGSVNYYGLGGDNRGNMTEFFSNIKELLYWGMNSSSAVKFYIGERNRLIMKCFHHDGVEILEVIRLNKKGEDRLQYYVDEFEMFRDTKKGNLKNYIRVSCWNDFK